MTTQSELPLDEPVDNPEQSTYTEYGAEQETPVDSDNASQATDTSTETNTAVENTPTAEQPAPTPSPVASEEQQRLMQERAELVAQQERDRTIRDLENEAIQMERNLMDQGLTQNEAQTQTQTHLEGRVKQIQQQQQYQQQVQVEQGKRNASVHFAKQYNLGIDALGRLEQAQTPTEMKAIAENMSSMAKLEKENAELKARLAPQQSFDTNTPTPAAATNEDRLLDAYLAGDRSEAANKAAAKLLGI
tara:strand:- start:434 stop:1174 length:741 start_codon:yes stop_codon:yes gene_type:complete